MVVMEICYFGDRCLELELLFWVFYIVVRGLVCEGKDDFMDYLGIVSDFVV